MIDMVEKIVKESVNIVEERLDRLREFFPEVFSEGKVDFEKLHEVLGNFSTQGEERYSFNWVGRQKAFRLFQEKAKGTLVFDKEESVEPEKTENVFIEGDNLEVLKLLQKSYQNKIKMMYIDPPYNTGRDFVYKDNFKDSIKNYLEQTGQVDSEGNKMSTNTETNGRFHSDWLTMMYPRLFLAKNLLKEDGVIFISIDDNEVVNLKKICDDIFGENNFVNTVVWHRKRGKDNSAKFLSRVHEYLLIYAKDINKLTFKRIELSPETLKQYTNPDNDERGNYRKLALWRRGGQGGSKEYGFTTKEGQTVSPRQWLVNEETMKKLDTDSKIVVIGDNLYRKLFLAEHSGNIPETIWLDTSNTANATDTIKSLFDGKSYFDTPKPLEYIERMLKLATCSGDIILDFFAGSGTTAHATLKLNKDNDENRKFICVQIPEKIDEKSEAYGAGYKTISEISRERIRRVLKQLESKEGFKAFRLTNSNYKIWDESVDDSSKLKKQLQLFETPLIAGYKELDVIYEVLIKEGYSLNSQIEKINIKSNRIYSVTDIDSNFFITLDSKIDGKSIDELKLKKSDIFVCLDSSLDDSQKKNISLKCDLRTI